MSPGNTVNRPAVPQTAAPRKHHHQCRTGVTAFLTNLPRYSERVYALRISSYADWCTSTASGAPTRDPQRALKNNKPFQTSLPTAHSSMSTSSRAQVRIGHSPSPTALDISLFSTGRNPNASLESPHNTPEPGIDSLLHVCLSLPRASRDASPHSRRPSSLCSRCASTAIWSEEGASNGPGRHRRPRNQVRYA